MQQDQFFYSQEYIDELFQKEYLDTFGGSNGKTRQNLDLLLGNQEWRKGFFDNIKQKEQNLGWMPDGDEKIRLQNLIGRKNDVNIMFDDIDRFPMENEM